MISVVSMAAAMVVMVMLVTMAATVMMIPVIDLQHLTVRWALRTCR
jgi:hypothetical protein